MNAKTGETFANGRMKNEAADFYQKYCICGIKNNDPIPPIVIEYNPSLKDTVLYD